MLQQKECIDLSLLDKGVFYEMICAGNNFFPP